MGLALALLLWAAPPAGAQIALRGVSTATEASPSVGAVAYRGSGSAAVGTGGNDITPTLPFGTTAGDLLVLVVNLVGSTSTIATPSGWTLMQSTNNGRSGSSGFRAAVFWRIAPASPSASTIVNPSAGGTMHGQMMAFTNPHPTSPIVASTATLSLNGNTTNAGAVAGGTAGTSMVVLTTHVDHDCDTLNSPSPGSWTQAFSSAHDIGVFQPMESHIAAHYRPQTASGTQSAVSGTRTRCTVDDSVGVQFVVESAGADGLAIDVPAGTTTNDVMLATLAVRPSTTTITAPSGWTLVRSTTNANDVTMRLYTWRRIAAASEPASYTWTFDGTSHTGAAGGIAAFSGVDTTNPVNVEGGQTTPSAFTHSAPSVTTTAANAWLVTMHAFTSSPSGWTPPTGMTELVDVASEARPSVGGITLEMAYALRATAGATGTRTATAASWGTDAGYGVGQSVALRRATTPTVHHYELSIASASLACVAGTVTVTACADTSAPCTNPVTTISGQTATLAASAGTLGATSVTFDGSGVATTTLSHAAAADGANVVVTLSGEATPGASARQCCQGGSCNTANSCSTTFSTAAFILAAAAGGSAATIPAQTAGTSSGSYVLRAVRSNTTTKACEAALTGSTSINWSYTCNDPTTCSSGNRLTVTGNGAVAVAGNPNSGGGSSTAVPMTFDANGNAPFSFAYADVGRITLNASRAAGGALLSALAGSSNAFVVRPAGFTLSGIRCSSYAAGSCATSVLASPGNNPGAADAAGSAFVPAGQAFSVTVTAVDALGNPTPNYGRESAPEGVRLSAALVAPAGGNAPALSNPTAFGSFAGGAATGTTFAWGEAGVITLTPSVADASYLGAGNVTGTTSGNVGRFYADHLTTTVTPACSASFSYAGQPFAATVAARNAAGVQLQNYGGSSFARAVTLSDGAALGVGSLSGGALAAGAFTAGVAGATPSYAFTNKLTAPGTLVLRATDSDGASSAGQTEGSTVLRSGRLRLANGFGRETAPLALTAQAEYWTGAGWLLNGSDSCTTVPAAAVAFSNQRDHLGAASTAWSTSASTLSLAAGSGLLTLAAPSPAGTGSVDIALNLGGGAADQSCLASHPASSGAGLAWLRSQNGSCAASFDRDPSARASFGIHAPETRRTVHAREIF